jgi:multiple sugar transport system permease protein
VSGVTATETAAASPGAATPETEAWPPPSYWPFVLPALIVVLAVIIFPWAYTIWMSLHEWKVGSPPAFVGLANYIRLPSDTRFVESIWHTLVYTALSVALPLLFGTLAAVVFHIKFPMRGFLRGLFILPMMATPVAIALVWTMMFHPQLGILNYLLSLVGLPPQLWVFHPATVIPSLVMVETWQWTPLVMLIVLGGLARDPGRALRERADRRRHPLADFSLHLAAADHAVPVHRRHDPHDRRGEEFRHHLRHYPRRSGLGVGDHQPLSLQRRLRLLRRRLRLRDRGRVLRADRSSRRRAAAATPKHPLERRRGRGMSPLRRLLGNIGLAFALIVIVSPAVLFFLWMLSLSVKFEVDNASYPPIFIPEHFNWGNYSAVFASNRFSTYFANSLIVTGTATAFALLVGVPAGYGLARMRAHKAAVVILIARITPGLSYLIPLFLAFQWLGLLGTLWPQIIIHLVVTVPIVIWIMIGYFETTPMELEESALIDGATSWQVFRYVALPIARPGIAIAFILAVIFSWNNFVFGIVLAGRETRTLPVAVYNMISFDQLSWGPLAAAALIVTLPVLLLTVFAQRQIVAGLTAGAVKGG